MNSQLPNPNYPELARSGLYFMAPQGTAIQSRTVRNHFDDIAHRFGAYDTSTVIELLNITKIIDTPIHRLSGGERKRANLAIAMARNPKVLLADDPLRDLDPQTVEVVGNALKVLARNGCAVLITGQNPNMIFDYADDILWLVAGRTHMLGSPAEAKQHERFCSEYLAVTA